MFRVPNTIRAMFRRFTKPTKVAAAPDNRTRLCMTPLEDRTVPTAVVTVASLGDVTEGGLGSFRATRTETSGELVVSFGLGGTATRNYDYLDGLQIRFEDGSGTADFYYSTLDDTESEPTETVVLTLGADTGYTVGTAGSATAHIFDNDAQVVSVATTANASEGKTAGTLLFTRTGDLSSSLTANISVSGTATSGTDYTSIGTTVTFAANSATADVSVAALPDAIYDPDETVTATVTSGTGYTVGSSSSASVSITDDISTVQTLVHQQTFQLTGSSGNVDVALTVTLNAPGAAGLYTWTYTVSNPSANTSSMTSFSIPVDGMDSDVSNPTSSIGWTGTVGTDSVSWAAGTGLTPGSSATFSFTTDPREIDGADVEAGGGGFFADLPTAPAPKEKASVPQVNVQFNGTVQSSKLKLDMTVADGGSYTSGVMTISASTAETARDNVYTFLNNNGWAVQKSGTGGLIILGKVQTDGSIKVVQTLGYKITDNAFDAPSLSKLGQVDLSVLP